jgi:hypothetical protein
VQSFVIMDGRESSAKVVGSAALLGIGMTVSIGVPLYEVRRKSSGPNGRIQEAGEASAVRPFADNKG